MMWFELLNIATWLMQVATVKDGNPWVCSVWQASDDDLSIYFFSAITRRHSGEAENNSKIAGALALPHSPEDVPRGLQFEGTVEKLDNDAIEDALRVYEGRVFSGAKIDEMMNHPERPHSFYKITPSRFQLFDIVNFPVEQMK
jgi:uncharacterized protein YhbP (UPF0306 family)